MSLHEKLTTDMKDAMRKKAKDRLSVIRMLLSEVKYAQAETDVHKTLEDSQVQTIVAKYHKKLSKSSNDYPEGEQRQAIQSELDIVAEYLPKAKSKEDVEKIIKEVISSSDEKNFGVLMKKILVEVGAGADGKLVSSLLKESLK